LVEDVPVRKVSGAKVSVYQGSLDHGAANATHAIEALFRQHRLPLVRLAILLTSDREATEDLVQDAFISLAPKLSSLSNQESAASYLRVATVNKCRCHLRRRMLARRHPSLLDLDLSGDAVVDSVIASEEHREILRLVATLSRRQREVIVLHYWSGLTEAQLAETLGVSAGTVKTTASRALANLNRRVTRA
jgi:RNA polymerase sigma factor (sigma-70 family)